MGIGTSDGQSYEDEMAYALNKPVPPEPEENLSPTSAAKPKSGQTVQQPNTDMESQTKGIIDFLYKHFVPDYAKDPSSEDMSDYNKKMTEVMNKGTVGKINVPDIFGDTKPSLGSAVQGGLDTASTLADPESRALFLGMAGMKRLLGEDAQKAAMDKFSTIGADLFKRNLPEDEIYKRLQAATGITFGADEIPRYEISNKDVRLKTENIPTSNYRPSGVGKTSNFLFSSFDPDAISPKLGDILHHPELFKAYPEAANIPIKGPGFNFGYHGAYYSSGSDTGGPLIRLAGSRSPEDTLSTILHEVQHHIQGTEGMALGGNPGMFTKADVGNYKKNLESATEGLKKVVEGYGFNFNHLERITEDPEAAMKRGFTYYEKDRGGFPTIPPEEVKGMLQKLYNIDPNLIKAFENMHLSRAILHNEDHAAFLAYQSLAGEVEARNVQNRINLDEHQIRYTPPTLTEDVDRENQVIRKNEKQP